MAKPKYTEPKWMKHPKQKGKAPFKVDMNLIDAYIKNGFVQCEAPKETVKKEVVPPVEPTDRPATNQEMMDLLISKGVDAKSSWDKAKLIEEMNKL